MFSSLNFGKLYTKNNTVYGKIVLGQITQNLCHSETKAQSQAREVLSGGELVQQAHTLPPNSQRAHKSNGRKCWTVGREAVCVGFDGGRKSSVESLTQPGTVGARD